MNVFVNNYANQDIINKLIGYQIDRIKESDAKVNIHKPLSLAKKADIRLNLVLELIEAVQIIEDIRTEKNIRDYIVSNHVY